MQYHYLGKTGVQVSEICLGTMTFGKEAGEATSFDIMNHCFEQGINYFDTANIYNGGLTEEIVGRWMGEKRKEIVLASKVHFPRGGGVNDRGSSKRHILLEAENCLRRLQTDWLDILYLHHWDDNTALEESLAAVNQLVDQGKVLYLGVSNFSAWQTVKALCVARRHSWAPPVIIQPMYNLVKRTAEIEILPMAMSEGIAVSPYSPIGAGLLTGKYLDNGGTGRIKDSSMYAERYSAESYHRTAQQFVDYAKDKGVYPSALAVAWVQSHPAITSTIIGARNMDQLAQALRYADIAMTPEMRAEISAFSPEPPHATDRESMATTMKQVSSGSHTNAK